MLALAGVVAFLTYCLVSSCLASSFLGFLAFFSFFSLGALGAAALALEAAGAFAFGASAACLF